MELGDPPVKRVNTKLDEWFDALSTDDQAVILRAFDNSNWQHGDLLEQLVAVADAPAVSDTTFGRFRRKKAKDAT